jgi:regulator of sirC expression with transglutaminase-like and TPR domain
VESLTLKQADGVGIMDFPRSRQLFYQAIHQPEEQIDLARAALYLAQEEYPELDVEEYLNALDTMAAEIQERLPKEQYPLRIIQGINQYLYDDLGFAGNTTDYYDPRNSFLNDVIDRRTGIPITLSLVYLEVAKRIDFPMVGINMPGHFLIRPNFQEMEVYVDAFHRGEILFPADCQERLTQIYGRPVELNPTFLETVSPRQFLARMLTNLKMIYLNQTQLSKALAASDRLLLLFPDSPMELRDRGLLYYHLDRWPEACQDLESYLASSPTAEDAVVIRQLLTRMAQNPQN